MMGLTRQTVLSLRFIVLSLLTPVVLAGCASSVPGNDSGIEPGTPISTEEPGSTTSTPSGSVVRLGETPGSSDVPTEPLTEMQFERVFSWFSSENPTHFLEANDGSGRIFVSEQTGRLIEVIGEPTDEDGESRTVLDITEQVSTRGNEEGFLGFALHPQFAENRRIFVYYSAADPRRSVISEFRFQDDGLVDPGSERVVMQVSQPYSNHNGGMLAFGPDGYLYIGLGDGGGSGDQSNNAQDLTTVLGSILRIDINTLGQAYTSPPDNPFVDHPETAPEIWAYGLRNPWRFSFDQKTGELWAADVGQGEIEEIDLITRGGNYGWRLKEGPECYNPSSGCEETWLIDPVTSYTHEFGCSVTGGYVYRGERLPSLHGAYIFGDFCSGIVWGLRMEDGEVVEEERIAEAEHQVPTFGQTLDGEVYMLSYSPGRIYRFVEN